MTDHKKRNHLSSWDAAHPEAKAPKSAPRDATEAVSGPQPRTGEPHSQPGVGDLDNQQPTPQPALMPPASRRLVEVTELVASSPLELPQRRTRRPLGGIVSFVVCVLLPTLLAGVYFFGYASNQYVVEFRFSVRDTNSSAVSGANSASGIMASIGLSSATNSNENYMVTEYMTSLQAVEDLQKKIDVRKLYSHPSVDFLSRMDASNSVEDFARYWKSMVTAEYDTITGIAVARVQAFTPQDAYLVAQTLLTSADDMINEVSQRPLREAVRFAEAEVKRAETRLKEIRADLAAYREKEGLIEPMNNVVLSNATLAGTIRGLLAQLQTDLGALQKQGLGANAAPVRTLEMRIRATEDQLKSIEAQVSRQGTGSALSPVVARYEALDQERQFAQNMLNSTMQSLEQARANAITKRLYIVPFIQPILPVSSTYPNRFIATLTVAAACLLLWTVALLLSRAIREHLA